MSCIYCNKPIGNVCIYDYLFIICSRCNVTFLIERILDYYEITEVDFFFNDIGFSYDIRLNLKESKFELVSSDNQKTIFYIDNFPINDINPNNALDYLKKMQSIIVFS